jgi:hypothetical protein
MRQALPSHRELRVFFLMKYPLIGDCSPPLKSIGPTLELRWSTFAYTNPWPTKSEFTFFNLKLIFHLTRSDWPNVARVFFNDGL